MANILYYYEITAIQKIDASVSNKDDNLEIRVSAYWIRQAGLQPLILL